MTDRFRIVAPFLALCLLALPAAARDVCMEVGADEGWQYKIFPPGRLLDGYSRGGWSVDDRAYARVGPEGHRGEAGRRLMPFDAYRFDGRYPFGTLLVRIGEQWLDWDGFVDRLRTRNIRTSKSSLIEFRINDRDDALGDNGGALTVCIVYP